MSRFLASELRLGCVYNRLRHRVVLVPNISPEQILPIFPSPLWVLSVFGGRALPSGIGASAVKVPDGNSADTRKVGKLCLPERFFSIPGTAGCDNQKRESLTSLPSTWVSSIYPYFPGSA